MAVDPVATIQSVLIDDARISVRIWGTGQPVLLIHGNPDSGIMWEDIAKRLGTQFLCLAPDLPGFGHSEVPKNYEPSLDGMARFVEQLIGALAIKQPIHLVAHDFGGPFAFAWAVRHAESVGRLVAINTLFFADYRWHFWARVWRTPFLGELSMTAMNRTMFGRELRRGSGNHMPQSHIDQTWALMTRRMKAEILRLYRATNPGNFITWEREFLALTANKPVLVIWGDADPYISSKYAERFGARKIAHLPNIGHWAPVEAPEECARLIMAFLKAEGAP
jgi:pimeloyl-ACP methyl ester carboxylesterase